MFMWVKAQRKSTVVTGRALHGRIAHARREVHVEPPFKVITATRKTPSAIAAPVQFWLGRRRCSSMVEHLPSKQDTRVRFPSPAPYPDVAQFGQIA